jgi:solute carrier family 6 GABA transporter-like protein 6/8/11/12/13
VVISFFLTTYYIVIIGWDLYFLFASLRAEVPWKTCNNTWNTEKCWDGTLNSTYRLFNDTKSPSEEFYRRQVLKESASMEAFGWPDWQLLLILVFAYIVVYFCIWKGVKSTGKVVYVTAIFPYLVIVIMMIRGVTLKGAIDGIKFFLIPKWADLLKPNVIL